MSDKTKPLPCPFCGGKAKVSSFPGAHNVWCENQPVSCGNRAMFTVEQWNTRAAAAEDVRAVVDEPVYQVRSHGSCRWEDISGESLEVCRSQSEEYEIRTLYRHPQRPVVMPERFDKASIRSLFRPSYVEGFNACIDEFMRLNP